MFKSGLGNRSRLFLAPQSRLRKKTGAGATQKKTGARAAQKKNRSRSCSKKKNQELEPLKLGGSGSI